MNEIKLDTIPQFKDNIYGALAFYEDNGFHVEQDVFTQDECEALIAYSAELPDRKKGFYRPQMMPHRFNAAYLDAMKNPKITKIMSLLVGGDVAGLQSQFFFGAPNVRGFSNHQDNFYVEAENHTFASAWTALTDVNKEMGCLTVYPGTHKEGKLPVRSLDLEEETHQDPNANDQESIIPEKYLENAVRATVPQGSVIFIHGYLVHGSTANTTDKYRYALLNTYIHKGKKFREGNYAKRQEVDVYA